MWQVSWWTLLLPKQVVWVVCKVNTGSQYACTLRSTHPPVHVPTCTTEDTKKAVVNSHKRIVYTCATNGTWKYLKPLHTWRLYLPWIILFEPAPQVSIIHQLQDHQHLIVSPLSEREAVEMDSLVLQ